MEFSAEDIQKAKSEIIKENCDGEIEIRQIRDCLYCVLNVNNTDVFIFNFHTKKVEEDQNDIKLDVIAVHSLKYKTFSIPYSEYLEIADIDNKFHFYYRYIEKFEEDKSLE